MKNNLILIFLSSSFSLFGNAPSYQLTKDFWNSPDFIRSFMGDYGFRNDIEPRVSKSEQFIIGEVIAKAESQMDEAIIYLEEKIDSKSSAALDFALATMYYQRGRLSKSAESYQKAIKKFPSFLRAYKNMGFVKLSLGQFQDAAESFSRSISLGEGDGVTFVALGYCHYTLEQYVSAENSYRMAILLLPKSKEARDGLVNCLIETERYPEALALLNEILAKEPENILCHRARASAFQGLGREEDATIALETLKRMGELKTRDLVRLGDLYHNLKLYELSYSNYELAIENEEKISISRYIRIASTLINRRSYEECFLYLDKIEKNFQSSISPTDEKGLLLLKAEVLQATGKAMESIEILRVLVEKHPLEGKALIMLAHHAWKQKKYSEASLYFERAAKINDSETEALVQHSRMLVAVRKYENAVRLLERAQSISPQERVEKYLQSIRNLLLSSRVRL